MPNQTRRLRKPTSIFATFRRLGALQRAFDQLVQPRFRKASVSVVVPESFVGPPEEPKPPDKPRTSQTLTDNVSQFFQHADRRTLPPDHRFLVSGPITACLDESGARGSISAALCRFGLPAYDAVRASESLIRGDAFLAVLCPNVNLAVEATEIMETADADTIGAAIDSASR